MAHGGHDIPLTAIERRFPASLYNLFTVYAATTSRTQCFLNSGDSPSLVFLQHGGERDILDWPAYQPLRNEADL